MRPRIELLVTDVDNTLFDGVRAWARAVRPMIRRMAAHAGWTAEEAERHIARVHAGWEATECPACLAALLPDRNAAVRDAMVRSYEAEFIAARPLYHGVRETLEAIGRAGARVVAYSESPVPFAARRLALLGLDRFVHALYAREAMPGWRPCAPWADADGAFAVRLEDLKPDPATLLRIVSASGVAPRRALYVGDNLWKDVRMARLAGVRSAWARYGTARIAADEALLQRLCHWTPADTEAERRAGGVRPDVVLDTLADVLAHFDFGSR